MELVKVYLMIGFLEEKALIEEHLLIYVVKVTYKCCFQAILGASLNTAKLGSDIHKWPLGASVGQFERATVCLCFAPTPRHSQMCSN